MFRIGRIIVVLGSSLRLALGSVAGVAVDVGVGLGVVVDGKGRTPRLAVGGARAKRLRILVVITALAVCLVA